jgi:phosphoglycolate phosphatase-like HAD superfamily hydrolase
MKNYLFILLVFSILTLVSCSNGNKQQDDPLPSWNETSIKKSIMEYITQTAQNIPVDDRIAVFDMDGTILCEKPLWFEMCMAVKGLNEKSAADPGLLKYKEFQYAQKLAVNPADTSVTNHWGNYIDSMVWKAYTGADHEAYIDSAHAYLKRTINSKYNMPLADLFYQPMLELIELLKANEFKVYIVSGSVSGVIWSVCPQVTNLSRAQLIGTTQNLDIPRYDTAERKTKFIIKAGASGNKNLGDGKSLNIYTQIGKIPVFAFGNSTGDFGMLRLTATSKYPHAEYLLNHDDSIREYAYPPYYAKRDTAWRDTVAKYKWNLVNMSREFKTVWMKK